MVIRVAQEQDRQTWDDFVLSSPSGSFLQTWVWGRFQEALGNSFWRLVVEDEGSIQAVALVIKHTLPFNFSWLYIPHFTPAITKEAFEKLMEEVKKIATQEKAIFIRADALTEKNMLPAAWQKAPREVQPKDTLLLDITKLEEELLSAMHQKTRYNIRVAQKHTVTVRFSTEAKDVEAFLALAETVSNASGFYYHPPAHYQKLITTLGSVGAAEIALAEYGGKVVAAHIMIYAGNKATYIHGASSKEDKQLMAPQLLYWETIRRAKAKRCTTFDFYGVAPETADNSHPWAGITRVKMGFGGKRATYQGAYDYIISPLMYMAYNWSRKLMKK